VTAIVCLFALGPVVVCFVTGDTNFFTLLGLCSMIISTVLGGSKSYRVFQFPHKPMRPILILSIALLFAGTATYAIVIGVTNAWTMWSFIAIGFELVVLSIIGFAIRENWKSRSADVRAENDGESEIDGAAPLTPDSGESNLEESKSETEIEEKEMVNVFVSPYEENGGVMPTIPRDLSVEMEIGNLPIGEAIPFQKPVDKCA
jgi:hypothetical protein